jgi:hypothetical protein
MVAIGRDRIIFGMNHASVYVELRRQALRIADITLHPEKVEIAVPAECADRCGIQIETRRTVITKLHDRGGTLIGERIASVPIVALDAYAAGKLRVSRRDQEVASNNGYQD